MPWKFEDDSPIYIQIVEEIKRQIASGELKGGDKMPAVRELALQAGVNPNTMQKAFAELERGGLINTQRTNGRTVTEDTELIQSVKLGLAKGHIETFVSRMKELGYTEKEILSLLETTGGKKYE